MTDERHKRHTMDRRMSETTKMVANNFLHPVPVLFTKQTKWKLFLTLNINKNCAGDFCTVFFSMASSITPSYTLCVCGLSDSADSTTHSLKNKQYPFILYLWINQITASVNSQLTKKNRWFRKLFCCCCCCCCIYSVLFNIWSGIGSILFCRHTVNWVCIQIQSSASQYRNRKHQKSFK